MEASEGTDKGFLKHVFNFDDDSKSEIINILQYALIAILPIILLNKTIGKFVPESDDKKGSLEISAEVLIQIIVTFLGLLLIHRIITFIPTYSGVNYPEFHIVYIILAVLMITMSIQTKLGSKVSILVDRIVDLWEGNGDKKKKAKMANNGGVKVSQPLAGNTGISTPQQQAALYTEGTDIGSLPMSEPTQQMLPNYDSMYRQDNNPLVNAAMPQSQEGFQNGPMAYTEFGGIGSSFGSAW